MFWENINVDAGDPALLAGFWASALGASETYREPGLVEIRLSHSGGPDIDLCFGKVPEAVQPQPPVHLDLIGGAEQRATVDRLLGLGAEHLDIGQHDGDGVPWVVLADPEGNPFCVMEERDAYVRTGTIAAVVMYSTDPVRDAEFWSWLSGLVPYEGVAPATLRHPSGHGPLVEFVEGKPDGAQRIHLDVRREVSDPDIDALITEVLARGGALHDHDWGPLPWTVFTDPSGNLFCILPAPD